ncbi:Lysyl endopeptidase precursor [Phycisphaerae bacterium RAS1]|nr:Lysyl endopeptidase precursor [Phycisphaerae bacterium RAS1]
MHTKLAFVCRLLRRWTAPSAALGMLTALRVAVAAGPQPTPAGGAPGFIDERPAELLPEGFFRRNALPVPISTGLPEAFQRGGNFVELDSPAPQEIEAADAAAQRRYQDKRPAPPRVGLARTLAQPLQMPDDAVVTPLDDGRRVWTLAVRSAGALEMRVLLQQFDVGAGRAIVYGFDDSGRLVARGPLSGAGMEADGEFWSPSVPGETMFIEVTGAEEPHFVLSRVIHCDRDEDTIPSHPERGDCVGVCSCHLDVMCESVSVAARQATGRMRFLVDGEYFVCTGTLLADNDSATYVPYFLTANHCIDSQDVFNTLEVRWNYQTLICNGSLDSNLWEYSYGGVLLTTSGANFGNDATFARLNGNPPASGGFAGWTTNEEIGDVGIHHPQGSHKRAVFGHYVTFCDTDCSCFSQTNYAYYTADDGIVQGGSSGSGMFTTSGQIIGQLYGHCGLCPDAEDCTHTGDWCLLYGEFAQTYPDIIYWLNLGGTLHVDDSNLTPPWDGSAANPFLTVGMAYNAIWQDNLRMIVHPGAYVENITFNRPLRIEGAGGVARIGVP